MIYQDNKVSDVQIAYIGGGSRGWAWTFMTDLALECSLSGTIRLYDIDQEAAQRNEVIGNQLSARSDVLGKWSYQTCLTLEKALEDVDFVVISILPGTFDEMHSDVHLPERLGIYQAVGDTTGPGGMIRSLRTIPMIADIAKAVERYASEAWVINYTNPMSLCIRTLYHVYPQIKAFGCCHEVFGTQQVLQGICEESLGVDEIDRHDIMVNVLGINHFTWFNEASYKGIDLLPVYRDYVEQHYDKGYDRPDKSWPGASFACANRVKFDLFRRYGFIAAAGDRHLAEFMPANLYLKNPEMVKQWKYGLTTVDWRKADLQSRKQRSQRLIQQDEQLLLKPTGEEGVLLIKALCGLGQLVSNVNLPNSNRQIPNLPESAVVETNAVFRFHSIKPLIAGNLPQSLLALTEPHVKNQELMLSAAFSGDRRLVYQAFLNDPLTTGRISENEVIGLVNEMIHNTRAYLPTIWQ